MDEPPEGRAQRGIQSIEVGGQLLRALAHVGRPLALKDLAREAGMSAAKAHPYLVSFSRLDLIEQDPDSGRYRLGPLALQLGLIALRQVSPVQEAAAAIADLVPRLGFTTAISVWGNRGPTVVHLEESRAALHVNMRHGTVFSLSGTATGRLFAAHLPAEQVKTLLEQERARGLDRAEVVVPGVPPGVTPTWREFSEALKAVRQHGLSRSIGETLPGINALSAPVFDHDGRLVLALTTIGPASVFEVAWDGAIAQALALTAAHVSQRLGAAPGAALAA